MFWEVSMGAAAGLLVRAWRYKIRGQVLVKNIGTALVSSVAVYYSMPIETNKYLIAATAYFAAQSGGHIESLKRKAAEKITDSTTWKSLIQKR